MSSCEKIMLEDLISISFMQKLYHYQ